jgi:putative transcriptional regulator
MRDELFNELLQSVREGGKILRGRKKASREFNFDNPDPRQIKK